MITINRIDCPDILKQGKNPKSKGELETIDALKFFSDQNNHTSTYRKTGTTTVGYKIYSDDSVRKVLLNMFNGKCAYCGASIDLIKKTEFEIDHFLYEKAPIFATKKDAGYMGNLILSCHDCNHNKNSFWIEKEEMDTLNPDGEKIKNVFIRDDKYYIWINDEFKENTTIEGFYNKLCLGSELHRLDYLIMNIIGLRRSCEDNSDLYVGLGKILDIIREKRNIM